RMNDVRKIVKNSKKINPGEVPSDSAYKYLEYKYGYRWKAFNIPPSIKPNLSRSTSEVEKDPQG
ncbi:MAG TPA: hypothetical protein VKK79_04185, partial [Candidatus Lokiarchaeia archaeon]|nr:hypothetical protein [Candidatus Lokiarchaeia archaeon]